MTFVFFAINFGKTQKKTRFENWQVLRFLDFLEFGKFGKFGKIGRKNSRFVRFGKFGKIGRKNSRFVKFVKFDDFGQIGQSAVLDCFGILHLEKTNTKLYVFPI